KDNRNSIRKEVLHLIKFVKKTVAIPIRYVVNVIVFLVVSMLRNILDLQKTIKISFITIQV
ncbi:hypothetical protein EGK08_13695, partial [Enterococcus faecium]